MFETSSSEFFLGEIPFIVRPLTEPTNSSFNLPDKIGFTLNIDPETGVIRQGSNKKLAVDLSRAYLLGAEMSGMMEAHNIGAEYAQDFLNYVTTSNTLSGKSVLEIGCGTGYLLSEFSRHGAITLGVEPGAHGLEGSKSHSVQIIRDFYPNKSITETFDFIVLYCVLEHIEDVTNFLTSLHLNLRKNGKVLIAVPNCQKYLENGDPSCFIHQHWSYFTQISLKRELARAGFDSSQKFSEFGGLIYSEAWIPDSKLHDRESPKPIYDLQSSITNSLEKLSLMISDATPESPFGIYPGIRGVNAIALLKVNSESIRLYDDSPHIIGTYYPGFDYPVKSSKSISSDNLSAIWISSDSFQMRLLENILAQGYTGKIITWDDVFVNSV